MSLDCYKILPYHFFLAMAKISLFVLDECQLFGMAVLLTHFQFIFWSIFCRQAKHQQIFWIAYPVVGLSTSQMHSQYNILGCHDRESSSYWSCLAHKIISCMYSRVVWWSTTYQAHQTQKATSDMIRFVRDELTIFSQLLDMGRTHISSQVWITITKKATLQKGHHVIHNY